MNILLSLLGETSPSLTPDWIVASFPIIRIILVALMSIFSIVIIVAILLQSHTSNDISVVNGQESYFAENKSQNKDGRLKKITIAMASAIFVVVVLYFVSCLIYPAV